MICNCRYTFIYQIKTSLFCMTLDLRDVLLLLLLPNSFTSIGNSLGNITNQSKTPNCHLKHLTHLYPSLHSFASLICTLHPYSPFTHMYPSLHSSTPFTHLHPSSIDIPFEENNLHWQTCATFKKNTCQLFAMHLPSLDTTPSKTYDPFKDHAHRSST